MCIRPLSSSYQFDYSQPSATGCSHDGVPKFDDGVARALFLWQLVQAGLDDFARFSVDFFDTMRDLLFVHGCLQKVLVVQVSERGRTATEKGTRASTQAKEIANARASSTTRERESDEMQQSCQKQGVRCQTQLSEARKSRLTFIIWTVSPRPMFRFISQPTQTVEEVKSLSS
jgi:hypothetical protein